MKKLKYWDKEIEIIRIFQERVGKMCEHNEDEDCCEPIEYDIFAEIKVIEKEKKEESNQIKTVTGVSGLSSDWIKTGLIIPLSDILEENGNETSLHN